MVMATAVIEHYAPLNHHVPMKSYDLSDGDHHHHGVKLPKQIIAEAMRQRIDDIDHERCEPGDEDTFFVADLGDVYRQYQRWKLNLPRIRPFYAVKCNPDPQVLKLLSSLGTGFDCASKAEIDQVLSLGLNPDRVIYAQPCKTGSYLRHVRAVGVKQMTFDNGDELRKIAKFYPNAELYLRIMTDDTSSQCRLSMKFGAAMDTTDSLLALASELGLNVVGVSFHVGSGASDPMAFLKAVRDSHIVFEQAREHGYDLRTLDVGGGFCGETFEEMAAVLTAALDQYFPPSRDVNIIAEPGRFFVSSAFTIACHVIARRTIEDPSMAETGYMVYVNDGVYGNFSCIMFDHYNPVAKILRAGDRLCYDKPEASASVTGEGIQYSIWGPTCDGIDRITESIRFDQILDVGDWIYFENMGAYTKCSATRFNGFSDNHDVVYVCSEPGAKALLTM
ncbi:Ornithine decarboxylase [Scedosporium apiospermum]|uniref:Ornithine decarboxylase n=1 Tax=Pseudallescheria apiosperma TaxID=563466 RepID=A0A084FVI0_PSEDA|nr:Ornithine decarboxylase [Scedosporium apiospermum]KEZ39092.1 Ornithine decarboxylase [Scedosporium apiospermum]